MKVAALNINTNIFINFSDPLILDSKQYTASDFAKGHVISSASYIILLLQEGI